MTDPEFSNYCGKYSYMYINIIRTSTTVRCKYTRTEKRLVGHSHSFHIMNVFQSSSQNHQILVFDRLFCIAKGALLFDHGLTSLRDQLETKKRASLFVARTDQWEINSVIEK